MQLRDLIQGVAGIGQHVRDRPLREPELLQLHPVLVPVAGGSKHLGNAHAAMKEIVGRDSGIEQ